MTLPADQFFLEGFSKPFRIYCSESGGGILLFVLEDIPVRLIAIEKAIIVSFFIDLTLHKKNGLQIVVTIPSKITNPHIWKSSNELWIFIPLVMII